MFYSLDNVDYSKIINEKCDVLHELPISTSELHIETTNIDKQEFVSPPSSLKVKMGNLNQHFIQFYMTLVKRMILTISECFCYIGPTNVNYISFVAEGWKQETSDKALCEQVAEAKNIELTPQKVSL